MKFLILDKHYTININAKHFRDAPIATLIQQYQLYVTFKLKNSHEKINDFIILYNRV